jgi:hypothetical protein
VEKKKEAQAKGIENKFSKVTAENFPNHEKGWSSRHRGVLGLQTD